MIKKLTKKYTLLINSVGITGDRSKIRGNVSGINGDVSGLSGDVSGLSGNVSGLSGDVSGLSGNVSDCDISEENRRSGIDINDLVIKND